MTVEVRMFFGKPGTETDPDTDAGGVVLETEARNSLRTRDVVIDSGHSGPFYGFAFANWRKTTEGRRHARGRHAADKYQVVLAEGCDTSQIGEAFKENPNKHGKNIDVITTTSFSDASTPASVEDFLSALLARDSTQRVRPQPVSTLLTRRDSEASGFTTMYGMHGIDDNPKLVPFANSASSVRRARRTQTAAARATCVWRWGPGARSAPRRVRTARAAAPAMPASWSRVPRPARSTARPARRP